MGGDVGVKIFLVEDFHGEEFSLQKLFGGEGVEENPFGQGIFFLPK